MGFACYVIAVLFLLYGCVPRVVIFMTALFFSGVSASKFLIPGSRGCRYVLSYVCIVVPTIMFN